MKFDKNMDSNQRLRRVLGAFQRLYFYLKHGWCSLIWVCLLLNAGYTVLPVAAEPSHSIQFLMREPVSMMDWGLQNIEDYLYRQRDLLVRSDKRLFKSEPTLAITYDWEQDKIQVTITLRAASQFQKSSRAFGDIRAHLEWVMKYLRGSLTLRPYDAFFRHRGFRSQDSPPNLGAELAAQTELLIRVHDAEANILSQCKGGLTGNEIIWLSIGN